MLKLKVNLRNDIPLVQMQDGDIGIITQWCEIDSDYVDMIVQRYKDSLVVLGESSGRGWASLFSPDIFSDSKYTNCRIQILQSGTELIV